MPVYAYTALDARRAPAAGVVAAAAHGLAIYPAEAGRGMEARQETMARGTVKLETTVRTGEPIKISISGMTMVRGILMVTTGTGRKLPRGNLGAR